MSILINNETKLVVQGITGKEGAFHTKQMVEYGTQISAGVTPRKGGLKDDNGIPIFNTVADAVAETGAIASVFLFHLHLLPMPVWKPLMSELTSSYALQKVSPRWIWLL